MIEIKHKTTGAVLHTVQADTLRGKDLSGMDLREVDLREVDLRRVCLIGIDLRGAVIPSAPVIPNIHQRVYKAASARGALDMSRWHTCDTTHCRAGWVVKLAGAEGAELERRYGTSIAAAMAAQWG